MAGDTSIRHNSFDPEMTGTMLVAMDSAWVQLAASGRVETMAFRAEATRDRMASAILDQARKGITDPGILTAVAITVIVSEPRPVSVLAEARTTR
jgi:hypothetical protein